MATGIEYLAPSFNSPAFNSSAFESGEGITRSEADRLYLSIFAGKNLGLIDNITPGTAAASKALILDGASSISGINSITFSGALAGPIVNSSTYLLAGTSVLMSALTGISIGTAAASKALVLDASSNIANIGTISQTVAVGGDLHVMGFTTASSRCSIKMTSDSSTAEYGIRGSTAGSYPNSYYMYSNGSYRWTMSMSNGDTNILSTTDSTSVSTGCLRLSGGLGVVKNIYCTGWLDLNRNGSNINITNPGSGGTALIELSASPSNLRLARGYILSLGSAGASIVASGTRDPLCPLDMGQTASNMIISLYNNTSSYYGFSANSSSVQYSSGGGHVFYSSCTNASPINTRTFGIASNGRVELVNNGYLGNSSYNNMLYFASTGTLLINSATVQNSGNWLEVNGSSYFSGNCGFGISSASYPIHINASSSDNITSYGYINTSGNIGFVSGSSGTIFVGLKCANRIVSGEINLVSDRRIKKEITDITDEEAKAFLSIRPVHYSLKKCNSPSYGYIAQDILKHEALKHNRYILEDIINVHKEEGLEETVDEDGFVSPADGCFSVNYPKIVPLLHKIIQLQESRIKKNETEISDLKYMVEELSKKIHIQIGDYLLL
jgi:hypothetical protein